MLIIQLIKNVLVNVFELSRQRYSRLSGRTFEKSFVVGCFAPHNERIDREGARLSCTADICHFCYCRVFNPADRPRSLRRTTGSTIRKPESDAFSRSISHCARNDRSPPLRAWYTYPDRNCRISVGCCGFPAKYITFLYVGPTSDHPRSEFCLS